VRGGGSGSGDEAEGEYGPGGDAPWPRSFRPVLSATPSPSVGAQVGPAGAPARPLFWNTRGCTCREDWDQPAGAAARAAGGALCTCGGVACPPHVDPPFLTEAEGQDVCSLRRHTGYGCTAGCTAEGKVNWFGFSCSRAGVATDKAADRECPPLVVTPSPTPSASPTPPPPIVVPVVSWDPAAVVDLHGVKCEFLDGVERCFNEDTQGRTLCPLYVTSSYLRNPPTSGEGAVSADIASLCVEPRHAEQYYCSVFCQDGNSRVQWWTHDVNWCYSAEGKGACPPRHKVVPKEDFAVGPWSEVPAPETPCQAAFRAGVRPRPGPIEGLTVGMLTHEPVAFGRTLETYDRRGLFPLLKEFLVYMNQRSEGLEAVLRPYRDKYGHDKIKVLGDATNVGIARGITYLTGNASQPYFMLLERDFWLIEPDTCVEEQLRAGIALLATRQVHVVRYRSQRRAGRPNWAENFFLGHENDAFVGRQPNLACNIHYWVFNASRVWPERFWVCGEAPEMICSDSFYCNWTNNPQMWEVEWWNREYVSQFDKFKRK
jgi:hypothetical protein